MASSDDSTQPTTPSSFPDADTVAGPVDAFALLRPVTQSAKDGWSATVDAAIKEPDSYQHASRFLHKEGRGPRYTSIFSEDSHGTEENDLSQRSEWRGAFALQLTVLPQLPRLGWVLGNGGQTAGEIDADLILAPKKTAYRKLEIARRHAILSFDPSSNRIVLFARHHVTIRDQLLRMEDGAPQRRVLESGELICIGECIYLFQYTEFFHSKVFESQLQEYMTTYVNSSWTLNELISPATVGQVIKLGEYSSSPVSFNEGTFGSVSVGWSSSGSAVAIKRFKTPGREELQRHRRMMARIGPHANLVQLIDVIERFESTRPEAYYIYQPLARMNAYEALSTPAFDWPALYALVADFAAGLAHLHHNGVMHRDITLGNLAILSFEPAQGLILDLDAATDEPTSTYHQVGTKTYLAPEIVALKSSSGAHSKDSSAGYEKSIDVWALGLCYLQMAVRRHLDWMQIAKNCHIQIAKTDYVTRQSFEALESFMGRLGSSAPGWKGLQVLEWIARMMQWQPSNRIEAPLLFDQARKHARSLKMDSITSATQYLGDKRPLEASPSSAAEGHARRRIEA